MKKFIAMAMVGCMMLAPVNAFAAAPVSPTDSSAELTVETETVTEPDIEKENVTENNEEPVSQPEEPPIELEEGTVPIKEEESPSPLMTALKETIVPNKNLVENTVTEAYIPKTIILNGNPNENGEYTGEYVIAVKGVTNDIGNVFITPDASVTLESSKGTSDASICQTKTVWNYDELNETDYSTTLGTITAKGLSAGC